MGIQENINAEARGASSRPPEFIQIPLRNWLTWLRLSKELCAQQWRSKGRYFFELKHTVQKMDLGMQVVDNLISFVNRL